MAATLCKPLIGVEQGMQYKLSPPVILDGGGGGGNARWGRIVGRDFRVTETAAVGSKVVSASDSFF